MDVNESGASLRQFLISEEASPGIREFIHQRLHIDPKPSLVWYRMDDQGNLRYRLLIKTPPLDYILVVSREFSPLPNLLVVEEDTHSTNNCDETTCPWERQLFKYIDKGCRYMAFHI
jgi:hypothetical protein